MRIDEMMDKHADGWVGKIHFENGWGLLMGMGQFSLQITSFWSILRAPVRAGVACGWIDEGEWFDVQRRWLGGIRMGSKNLPEHAVFKHSGRSRRERQMGEGVSGSIKSLWNNLKRIIMMRGDQGTASKYAVFEHSGSFRWEWVRGWGRMGLCRFEKIISKTGEEDCWRWVKIPLQITSFWSILAVLDEDGWVWI